MPYTVESGDTFWSISQKLDISLEALQVANPGVNADSLSVGQELQSPGMQQYTIASGDTLWSIAQAHGVSVDTLFSANPGINADALTIGQVINISDGGQTAPSSSPQQSDHGYVQYSGPASNFPDPNTWASWDDLWSDNERLMRFHDSDAEIADIKQSIEQISGESGVDARVILCIIMQESGGDVRVITSFNPIRNPGIMQSHNGVEFDKNDPAGSILQMIRDGTEGTNDGPGLKQLFSQSGNWYTALRMYNSGSVNPDNLNDPFSAVDTYVQSTANRLMGHIWDQM